jgi:uncharacterized protein (DUF1330 family)
MNRGLIGFLTFLAVLLFGLALIAYLLGPNVLSFVFHAERRTQSVVIVDLLEFADASHVEPYRDGYQQPAAALIQSVGGKTIWRADADQPVSGAREGHSILDITRYPSRAAYIELVTSSDYRALMPAREATARVSAVLETAQSPDFEADAPPVRAVRWLVGSHEDSLDRFEAQWLSADAAVLARHSGRVIWRARLNPLVGAESLRFDAGIVYAFPDTERRAAWLEDRERLTLGTLEGRLFRHDILVLTQSERQDEAQ